MSTPVWLEVALNGPWSRARQPLIPITREQIVNDALACADTGASIIHLHAYDEATGRQRDDYEIYAPIIERIRSRVDLICYPTIPFAGSVDSPQALAPEQRYKAVLQLVRAGLIEWAVVDPGSTNIAHYADLAAGREGFVYANPESHVKHGLALAREYRMTPTYAIYEPGFMRLGAALHRGAGGAPLPVYRLMFASGVAFGFPPLEWALDAYLKLLAIEAPKAPWMVAGLEVDVLPLVDAAVARGGHVRTGLEDMPLGCEVENRLLVERAERAIGRAGGRAASVAEVRAALAALNT